MWSFEVHYVVIAHKMSVTEGGLYGDFCHIRLPPMGSFFELQQHNVPQKITFFMNIYDYKNECIV